MCDGVSLNALLSLRLFFFVYVLLVFVFILSSMSENEEERTFIAIKPDGVQRGLIGEIIKRFEQKGFKLVAMKLIQVN